MILLPKNKKEFVGIVKSSLIVLGELVIMPFFFAYCFYYSLKNKGGKENDVRRK